MLPCFPNAAAPPPALAPEETAILDEAQRDGSYVRTGRHLAVLVAWQRRCRAAHRPCVVAIRGAREATITVDDQERRRGPVVDLECEAAKVAASVESRNQEQEAANA
jgi:hypothetical protein